MPKPRSKPRPKPEHLDQAARARQKQERRERDAERLARGEVTRTELQRENSFFGALKPSEMEIIAIGGKPLKHIR